MRWPIFGMLAFLLLLALPADAANEQDWSDCEKSGDLDRRIAGCTNILNELKQSKDKRTRANAYFNRAWAWERKREYDRSIADYTKALRLDPRGIDIYVNRGTVWIFKGEIDRAMADLNEAIRRDPKNASAYLNRSIAWGVKGDHARASADRKRAIALDPKISGSN